jgi:hypothetical protein
VTPESAPEVDTATGVLVVVVPLPSSLEVRTPRPSMSNSSGKAGVGNYQKAFTGGLRKYCLHRHNRCGQGQAELAAGCQQ